MVRESPCFACEGLQPQHTVSPPKSGEKEDGHIAVNSNESILFFDNIFPLKLSTILNRPWKTNHDVADLLQRFESSSLGTLDPIRLVKTAIPQDMGMKVTEINPRLKDGGAFVNLSMRLLWTRRRLSPQDSKVTPSDLISQLQSWLDGSSDTFIVVMGPKGSGKKEMVMDQALKGRKNILTIDCRPIIEARERLAPFVNSRMQSGTDPSSPGRTVSAVSWTWLFKARLGVKAGFSETLESQLTKILYTTSAALKDVALSRRTKKDKDADLSDDAYLDSHPEKRPILVIDNFLHKADDQAVVYEKIAEWAASIVQNKIAHVVFLTNDSSFTKTALQSATGSNHEEEVAENESDEKDGQPPKQRRIDYRGLNASIEAMGGRLTDLEFLTRRIKAGQSPQEALDEIVDENATDIVKIFLRGKNGDDEKKWSVQQAWHLIKSLSQGPSLRYNEVVLSAPFSSSLSPGAKDAEAALEGLANAELISIKYNLGRPQTIKASKPLNQAAFQLILNDTVLRAKMELANLTEMSKVEAKTIETAETELSLLGHLPKQTRETSLRVSYLLKKLESSQQKITDLEREMGELKQILRQEH
ncbi:unnamed protein product [Clonostachys rosea f. rosea IK726]|uniref:Uncharacterized protein n=1 Tax=Clonostachys rosea f. rosea IK726 TaxID=1349383 RepID=A0ACA9UB35_BIOOC|nr:unnamed protein product [Clonostachys rosea f. rosea IK726]